MEARAAHPSNPSRAKGVSPPEALAVRVQAGEAWRLVATRTAS